VIQLNSTNLTNLSLQNNLDNNTKNDHIISIIRLCSALIDFKFASWKFDDPKLRSSIRNYFNKHRVNQGYHFTLHCTEYHKQRCSYLHTIKVNTDTRNYTVKLVGLNNNESKWYYSKDNKTMINNALTVLRYNCELNDIYCSGSWCTDFVIRWIMHENTTSLHTLSLINPNQNVTVKELYSLIYRFRKEQNIKLTSFTYRGEFINNADFMNIFTAEHSHYADCSCITHLNIHNESTVDLLTTQMIIGLLQRQTQLEHLVTHKSVGVNENVVREWIVNSGRNVDFVIR
jgi:hypothetical protein